MLDAVATLVATVLLATTAGAVALVLGARQRAALAPATLVVAGALVVVQTIVLSLLGALTQAGLLVAGAVTAVAGAAVWAAAGRPRVPCGWRRRPGTLGVATRQHPEVALLAAVAGAAMAVQAVVAVAIAPSNWDSMTYHLSRAAYWLQYESATPFSGGSVRQLDSPPNGEILQAWTMAVTGTDRFAALVQWLALAGVASLVFMAARLLRFDRAPAVFAAALFVVLPQPLLQASSTQNDLITAFYVLAVAVFGVRGLRDRRAGDLAIAAVAAGVAVGTKGTVLALAPSLAIILGAEAWRRRPPRRLVLGSVAGLAAAVLVLGSWGYVQNVAHGESPLGRLAGKTARTTPLATNAVHVLWTFVDAPGIRVPVLGRLIPGAAHAVAQRFERDGFRYAVDTGISEDTSSYGLVGWFVLGPLVLFYAVHRRAGPRRTWALAALAGVLAFAVAFQFNVWVGRLLLPTVALAAPLFAALALRRPTALLTVIAAVAVVYPTVAASANKPLLGDASVQRKDRIGQMSTSRPDMESVTRVVEQRMRPHETLAFVGSEDSWDYPFFGERRERRVVRFATPPGPTPRDLRASGARAALFANTDRPSAELRPEMILPGYWFVQIR
ncbi:MAG: hypothetical protein QOC64_720 [Solirubrobacteraceae bacterium]|nr:hypothetical protein [Solirubrobacteraceae bacterium]